MLTEHLDVTYSIVWSIALANVLGAGLCFVFSNQLARVASVRIGTLLPIVLAIMFMGAFQGSRQWGDLYVLLGFGALGWVMKRLGWPRPPLILGFVLGGIIERYLFISIGRYGSEWITQPLVIVFFSLACVSLATPLIRALRSPDQRVAFAFSAPRFSPSLWFPLAVIGALIAAVVVASAWPFAARVVPQAVAGTALICITLSVVLEIFARIEHTGGAGPAPPPSADAPLAPRERLRRSAGFFLWCGGYLALALLIGILPALAVFVALFMRFWGREPLVRSLLVAGAVGSFCWLLFDRLLAVPWPGSLLGAWVPALAPYLP